MSNISIHLSSSDLEKLLLDKNGELNIVISEQIANKFASKYLKSIIHNEVMKKTKKSFTEAIHKEIDEVIGRYNYHEYITKRFRELIYSCAEKAVQEAIDRRCKETASELLEDEKVHIEETIKNYFEKGMNNLISLIADQQFNVIQQNFWNAVKNTSVKEK